MLPRKKGVSIFKSMKNLTAYYYYWTKGQPLDR
jgi:hypothetical protein